MLELLLAVALSGKPEVSCLVHPPSGIVLGAAPPGLHCSPPRTLDANGGRVVAYDVDGRMRPVTATMYVYRKAAPPEGTAAHHLKEVLRAVSAKYSDIACSEWQPDARPAMVGLRCKGHSPEIGRREILTYIGVESLGAWWLKLRATAPASHSSAIEQDLDAILHRIHTTATSSRP